MGNAITALDELKAEDSPLTGEVESSRRQMRSFLGRAPNAPVSLIEAITDEGHQPATDRERALIQAVDRGLLNSLGGRGEAYENLLLAIAAAVTDHPRAWLASSDMPNRTYGSSPEKTFIREEVDRRLLERLHQQRGEPLNYFGLPGAELLDIRCWKPYLGEVAAVERDPGEPPCDG